MRSERPGTDIQDLVVLQGLGLLVQVNTGVLLCFGNVKQDHLSVCYPDNTVCYQDHAHCCIGNRLN